MRTSEVEANLITLNESAKLAFIDDLVDRKRSGPEKGTLQAADLDFHTREYERLTTELESAYEASMLPEMPSARGELNDLLVRLRLKPERVKALDELTRQAQDLGMGY